MFASPISQKSFGNCDLGSWNWGFRQRLNTEQGLNKAVWKWGLPNWGRPRHYMRKSPGSGVWVNLTITEKAFLNSLRWKSSEKISMTTKRLMEVPRQKQTIRPQTVNFTYTNRTLSYKTDLVLVTKYWMKLESQMRRRKSESQQSSVNTLGASCHLSPRNLRRDSNITYISVHSKRLI